jgi:hypothetical protein
VPIPAGTKGPHTKGWNLKENALKSQNDLPLGYGIGLAHAYSGTMALDIDNWTITTTLLAEHGIDLQALYDAPDAVVINSGKPGHGKLLYTMPFGAALPSKKIMHGGITAYELRCATASGLTVQDVMPPSIHPETQKPYTWAGRGHWTRLPVIPQALLDLWNGMLNHDKERTIATDGAVDASWEEIRQALDHISPDCSREEWINCGMALHWAGTQTDQLDQALALWNEWSKPSDKYPTEGGVMTQWNSFKTDKTSAVKLGTLFHIAKQYGWHRPLPEAASLFSKVTVPAMDPVDVLDGLRPKPPEMNMELWPGVLRQRAHEVSESVGCDPLVPLFAGLAAVCGVIDARIRLELMPGFKVPPVLWLMTLGDPADKKSPGSRPMLAPLKNLEAEDRPRFNKEFLEYEGKEAAYASAKKSFLEWSASPDAMLGGDAAPPVPDAPTQPVPLKITVSDVTSQKLVRHAAERPRGLLCYLDEMNSWIRKMTDKMSGEDRSAWVVAYESEYYEMDRVGAGSIHAENFAVSIYGNIQPQVFKQNVTALAADGMLQRFVPGILRGSKTKLGHPVPECMTSAAAWENTLRLIYALPAQTYQLSHEAFTVYREFQSWYEQAKQDERVIDSGSEYMTAFGKLEGLAGRFILLFHVMEAPFSPNVSVDVVNRAIDLIKGYVIPAYRYALGEVGGVIQNDFDQWVIDHIIQNSADVTMIDLRTLKRSARRPLEGKTDWQKDQAVMDAMLVLEQAGWVVQVENELHKKRVIWAIKPGLPEMFKGYRERVIKAKQRHADYIYRYAYDHGKERKLVKGYDPDTMDEK